MKTENQILENGKSANCNKHQSQKMKVFWHKNRKTDLKNSQNHKTKNPNAPLSKGYCQWQTYISDHISLYKLPMGKPQQSQICFITLLLAD